METWNRKNYRDIKVKNKTGLLLKVNKIIYEMDGNIMKNTELGFKKMLNELNIEMKESIYKMKLSSNVNIPNYKNEIFTDESIAIFEDFRTISKELFEVLEQHMEETFTYEDLSEGVKKCEIPPIIKDLNEKMKQLIKEIKENKGDIRYDKKEIIAILTQ